MANRALICRLMLGSAAFALSASYASAVSAQEAEPTDAAAQEADGSGLDDIVVTAQRRSERLQDVPIAVTAVSGALAADVGVLSARDLSLVAPAVNFQTGVWGGGVTIRGIGGSFGAGDEPPNAIYVDGVYQASAPSFLAAFNNVDRIEVLKGPQGTLFGRNASGGVIQVVTKTPSFDPELEATFGYGTYQTLGGSLYASTGLSDTVAIDIAGVYEQNGKGYGTNLATGDEIYKGYSGAVRSKLLWNASDTTRITVVGLYGKVNPLEAEGGQIWPGYVDRAGGRGAGFRNANRNDYTGYTVRQAQGALTIEHDAPWATLVSITSYDWTEQNSSYDQDGTAINLLTGVGDITSHTLTQEFRVQSLPSARIGWIGGIYFYDNTVDLEPVVVRGLAAAGFGGSFSYETEAPSRSYAGFGQLTVPFGDLTLTLGGRYTIDDKKIDIALLNAAGSPIPLAFSANPRRASTTFEKFTYRAALDYKITPDLMIYGSLSTGFKAGAYGLVSLTPAAPNATATFPPPVEPQTVTAYETGFKFQTEDRQFRVNGSAYYYDFNNIQLRTVVPGGTALLNAAKAHSWGLDLDVAWRPTPRLTLQGSAAYLFSEYDDFPNAPFYRPNVNGVGVPTGGLTQYTEPNAKGKRAVNSPKLVTSMTVDFRVPLAGGEIGLLTAWEYNDGYFFDPQNLFRSDSRHMVNATLSWTTADERLQLSGWVRNLLGERYAISNNTSALGPMYWANAPRTAGVRARIRL